MPTYDYKCSTCGHTYELFQPITSRPVKKCPECGRSTAKRLIGAGSGIIFKGSGFYVTDSRGKDAAESQAVSGDGKKDKAADKKQSSETKSKNSDD